MNKTLFRLALLFLVMGGVPTRGEEFTPIAESLLRYQVPDWYRDAKFGLFLHWGPYSVPAYGHEWYPHNMYVKGDDIYEHHKKTWGDQKKFGYKDFIPLFKAEKWNPADWADLFVKAGAKFVVPVTEHHDGFAMYASTHTKWNSVRMGPHRDVYGELSQAIRAKGLKVGASSHYGNNWYYYTYDKDFDTVDPANAGLYSPQHPADSPASPAFLKQWYARACEIADKYKPDLFYFDFEIAKLEFKDLRTQFLARYYNQAAKWKKPVVVTYKEQAYPIGAAVEDVERGMPAGIRPLPFEADTSVGWKSWCYIENESYKDVGFLLNNLIDVVSKNGTMLLNLGPKADGTIPDQSKDILLKIGDWLKVNGEAIYGTRPWLVSGEGPYSTEAEGQIKEGDITYGEGDARYTLKGDSLYILVLKPGLKPLSLRQLGKKAVPNLVVKGATLLGSSEEVKWKRDDTSLVLEPPKTKPGDYALVYKVALGGFALGGLKIGVKGYDLTVRATFQNYGDAELTKDFTLKIDGQPVTTTKVTVGSHLSETFTLSYTATYPALCRLSLDSAGIAPLTGDAGIPAIDLTGEWLFAAGDRDQWQKPGFDDSTWEKQNLPAKWEAYGHHMDFSYGWYRKKVMIPAEWKGKSILLPLGKIDDADVSYFNGYEIGGTGKMPPRYEGAWDKERHYEVPSPIIRYGQENEIAIRVYNAQGDAGLYAGPLGPIEIKR